jgi:hypothetical protein
MSLLVKGGLYSNYCAEFKFKLVDNNDSKSPRFYKYHSDIQSPSPSN